MARRILLPLLVLSAVVTGLGFLYQRTVRSERAPHSHPHRITPDQAFVTDVWRGKAAEANRWLNRGANPNARFGTAATEPVLNFLVRRVERYPQLHTTLELILRKGADPNGRDDWGETSLMEGAASPECPVSVLRLLLEHGADLDAFDNRGWSALMHAINEDNLPAVKVLLQHGASTAVTAEQGLTPLKLAHTCGADPAILKLLKAAQKRR